MGSRTRDHQLQDLWQARLQVSTIQKSFAAWSESGCSSGDGKLGLYDSGGDRDKFFVERSHVQEVNRIPIIICPLLLIASASSEA